MSSSLPQSEVEDLLEQGAPLTPEQEARLKAKVLELSQRILALAGNRGGRIEDLAIAQEIAQTIKPYVDRLVALQRLLHPVDRIVDKHAQLQQLQRDLAADVAEVEDLSSDMADAIDSSLLAGLQSEIALLKRDRKLFVRQIDAEDEERTSQILDRSRVPSLLELPVPARLELILGERFISLSRLAEILNTSFPEEFVESHNSQLDQVWETLFATDELRPHVEQNRIKTLRNTFCDYALLFRTPHLYPPRSDSPPYPCTLENLRKQFRPFFLDLQERNLWYASFDFYRAPMTRPHWALVDRRYLNCTFKKPSLRLLLYARANNLPAKMVRQKSALEEVYDRLVLQLALKDPFFEPCNSITSTTYQSSQTAPLKQVYIYCKEGYIRISGKRGLPHWRPTRPRWPGVLPAIIFF